MRACIFPWAVSAEILPSMVCFSRRVWLSRARISDRLPPSWRTTTTAVTKSAISAPPILRCISSRESSSEPPRRCLRITSPSSCAIGGRWCSARYCMAGMSPKPDRNEDARRSRQSGSWYSRRRRRRRRNQLDAATGTRSVAAPARLPSKPLWAMTVTSAATVTTMDTSSTAYHRESTNRNASGSRRSSVARRDWLRRRAQARKAHASPGTARAAASAARAALKARYTPRLP